MEVGHNKDNQSNSGKASRHALDIPNLNQSLYDQILEYRNSFKKNTRIKDEVREGIRQRIAKEPLNARQREAVLHTEGPLLIRAGAGTGKTRVIACKIAKLISLGVVPRRILAVTFTNKATDEMRHRVKLLTGDYCRGSPTIKTIHGLCATIIRSHYAVVGLKESTTMMPDYYQERFIKNAINRNSQATWDALAKIKGPKPHKQIMSQISIWKNNLLSPDEVTEKYIQCCDQMRKYMRSGSKSCPPENEYDSHEIYQYYEKIKQRASMIDADDLLLLTEKIFTEHENSPRILDSWQNHYDFIFVDETQDTNLAQFTVLKSLAQKHQNITFVGDEDQSIYVWRGADVELFRDIPNHFIDTKAINLIEHYRCTAPIIALGNQLMTAEKGRDKKEKLVAVKKTGPSPELETFSNNVEEAQYIAAKIKELCSSGYKYEDITILLRRKKAMEPIFVALKDEGIPYIKPDEEMAMNETRQNLFAFYSVIHDPVKNEHGFMLLLENSRFSISKMEFESLDAMLSRNVFSGYWEALRSEAFQASLSPESRKNVRVLVEVIESLNQEAVNLCYPDKLSAIADKAICKLYPAMTRRKEWRNVADPSFELRVLQQESSYIKGWEKKAANPNFHNYIGWVHRLSMLAKAPEKTKSGAVSLETYHSFKGSENKVIFLPSMVEGVLPSVHALEKEGKTGNAAIDEERRIAYVGMTRALEILILSYSMTSKGRGNKVNQSTPSRFLDESGASGLNGRMVIKRDKTEVKANLKIKKRPKKKYDPNQTDFF